MSFYSGFDLENKDSIEEIDRVNITKQRHDTWSYTVKQYLKARNTLIRAEKIENRNFMFNLLMSRFSC